MKKVNRKVKLGSIEVKKVSNLVKWVNTKARQVCISEMKVSNWVTLDCTMGKWDCKMVTLVNN